MTQPKTRGRWESSAEYRQREDLTPGAASHRLARRYRRGDPRVRRLNHRGAGEGRPVYEVWTEDPPYEPGTTGPEAETLPPPDDARRAPRQLKRRGNMSDAEQARTILHTITAALRYKKKSPERAEAIRQIHLATGLSRPTIRRAIKQYEDHGLNGLVRARRPEAGRRLVLISRDWDKTVPLKAAVKRKVRAAWRRYVRSLWRSDAPSAPHVKHLSEDKLFNLTRAALDEAGVSFADAELRRACRLPEDTVERDRHYSVIAVKERDAKNFSDHIKPRGTRSRARLRPMDCVVGDVHHLDCLVVRWDGTTATPKMISWYDLACNRVFTTVVLLSKNKGVTQRMVASSFAAMVRDPSWGLPRRLYLDNGAEFQKWPDLIAGVMKLAQRADMAFGDLGAEPEIHAWAREVRDQIIRSRPYNSPARGSQEGFFGLYERGPGAMLPGAIPGNRMVQRTKNEGEAHEPHPGDFAAVVADVEAALNYYHATPQSGHLGGRSPNAIFAAFVADGWTPVTVPEEVLIETLAVEEIRVVSNSTISLGAKVLGLPDGAGAREYFHPELALLNGERVSVRVTLLSEPPAEHVAIWGLRPVDPDATSQYLYHAALKPVYDFFDRAGAREQSRMASEVNAAIRQLKSETDELDLVEEMRAWTASQPVAPVPSTVVQLAVPEAMAEAAAARAQLPEPEREDASLARRRRLSLVGEDPPEDAEEAERLLEWGQKRAEELEREYADRQRAEAEENERLRQEGDEMMARLEAERRERERREREGYG